ncbi:hypothetical protein H477_2307 [[Clostridium] sordellii ATCC 9714]|nr:hypothetical protein H477_2307 [[Clostridium] sordellii ATCC 9714] [Paeniclostridium sordellii ATCC 9714]
MDSKKSNYELENKKVIEKIKIAKYFVLLVWNITTLYIRNFKK